MLREVRFFYPRGEFKLQLAEDVDFRDWVRKREMVFWLMGIESI